MDSLFSSTLDTVAHLHLRRIKEKSPTLCPKESRPENGEQLEKNETKGFSYCLAGK